MILGAWAAQCLLGRRDAKGTRSSVGLANAAAPTSLALGVVWL